MTKNLNHFCRIVEYLEPSNAEKNKIFERNTDPIHSMKYIYIYIYIASQIEQVV